MNGAYHNVNCNECRSQISGVRFSKPSNFTKKWKTTPTNENIQEDVNLCGRCFDLLKQAKKLLSYSGKVDPYWISIPSLLPAVESIPLDVLHPLSLLL